MEERNKELQHYGVKGMRWGVRRYQKKDGTLTRRGERHKRKVVKGLEDGIVENDKKIETYKKYVKTNKKALAESKAIDKKNGTHSWNTLAIEDAYKATGRAYVDARLERDIYKKYLKAYSNDTIKIGEDYVKKFGSKIGAVKLTESGRAKESMIVDETVAEYRKKYAKEIKRYT